MTRADIESSEGHDIRRRYAGKQAPRANRTKLTATMVMDGKGLMKLESEQHEKELRQAAHSAGGEKKAKQRQRSLQSARYTPSSATLNFFDPSYVCKGRREDPIQVHGLAGDRELDDVETEVYNQLLQHRFAPIISKAEALLQVVHLVAVRTLGITLCLRSGGGDGRGTSMVSGVIKGLGLLRIRIFGYCSFWVSYISVW